MLEHESGPVPLSRAEPFIQVQNSKDKTTWQSRDIHKAITHLDGVITSIKDKTVSQLEVDSEALETIKDFINIDKTGLSGNELDQCIKMEAIVEDKLQTLSNSLEEAGLASDSNLRENVSHLLKEEKSDLNILKSRAAQRASYQAIQKLPDKELVTEGVEQVPVLEQVADQTSSGFENCGYHALKNALIFTSGFRAEEMSAHLKDPDSFHSFYDEACAPLLTDKAIGKKDASVALIMQIIHNMETGAVKVQNLASNHQLAVLQMSSPQGDKPVIGFVDFAQCRDGLKLYRFAHSPGPSTFTLVVGDEDTGHWYTLNISKHLNGTFTFLGCDSMDNHHDITGIYSALGKLAGTMTTYISAPQEYLKKVFEPIDEQLSRRAGWFELAGRIPPERAAQLLDNTPNHLLAGPQTPTGSEKERVLANCLAAFEIIQEGNWLGSKDYWCCLKIDELKTLIDFYVKELPDDDPQMEQLQHIQEVLRQHVKDRFIEATFQDAIKDIDRYKATLNTPAFDKISTLFSHMQLLYNTRKTYTSVENEDERNNLMNTAVCQAGIEQGFVTGKDANDAEKSLKQRVDILLLAYQEAKRLNRMDDFVKVVVTGDPCLTGRMSRVVEFYSSLKGIGGQAESANLEKVNQQMSFMVSTLIQQVCEDEEAAKAVSVDSFNDPKMVQLLAGVLRQYGEGEKGDNIRSFLRSQSVITDETNVNWEEVVEKLKGSHFFKGWIAAGKADASKWL